MPSDNSSSQSKRDALRQRWLQQAEKAFEEMFEEGQQEHLVTLTQREDRACLLAEQLAAFLLREHISEDALVRPDPQQPPCCPRCEKPGRALCTEDLLPQRELTTRAGPIQFRREQWWCATCRVAFFPSGPTPQAGH